MFPPVGYTVAKEYAVASFSYSVPVQSSFSVLWALVCDVRRVAGLFPFTVVDDFREVEHGRSQFRRRVTIPTMADLCWQELSWVQHEGELCVQAVEGDLQTFDGQWLVAPDGAGMRLTLKLEYDIPAEMRANAPDMMVNYAMGELFKTICSRIKEAAEEETA